MASYIAATKAADGSWSYAPTQGWVVIAVSTSSDPDGPEAEQRRIGGLPLVAIAGMTPERAPGVMAAGADSIAVITDFITHPDPEARVREWLRWAETAV